MSLNETIELTEVCDPSIEECIVASTTTLVEAGDFNATIILGVVALVQAFLPIILRYGPASSGLDDT